MSLKRISQLPSFNGVGAGQTATLDLPVGPRYHVLWLRADNTAHGAITAIIDEIRIKVNGKVQRTMSASELNALNALNNAPTGTLGTAASAEYSSYQISSDDSFIPIFMAEPFRGRQLGSQFMSDALAWATGDIASLQLEVDLNATNAGVALSAYAEVDNAIVTVDGLQKSLPMGQIVKWERHIIPYSGNGVVNWDKLPKSRGSILGVHFFRDGTNGGRVSDCQVLADNYEWRNVDEYENAMVLKSRGMTPTVQGATSGQRYDLVFDYDEGGSGLVVAQVQSLQLNLTIAGSSAAGSITAISQTLGRPD
jgi:hypothetical protein